MSAATRVFELEPEPVVESDDRKEFFVYCAACGHDWLVAVIPMDVDRFCAKTEAALKAGCPKCDGHEIYCGRNPFNEAR